MPKTKNKLSKLLLVDLAYKYANQFNYYLVLTKYIIHRLKIDKEKYFLMEGFAPKNIPVITPEIIYESVMYVGKLDKKYGIKKLVDSPQLFNNQGIEL